MICSMPPPPVLTTTPTRSRCSGVIDAKSIPESATASLPAAMAKWIATESAQRVIDNAVQLHGARGVTRGEPVERLYREIRALRIYEGTSEIQKLVIAGQLLRD